MTEIDTEILVNTKREAIIKLPRDIEPGIYPVHMSIGSSSDASPTHSKINKIPSMEDYTPPKLGESNMGPLGFTVHNSGAKLTESTYRREDLYGDDGR